MTTDTKLVKCGVVMPISAIDGCSEHHWSELFAIIKDAIFQVGFEASLVSEADDVGVIHKRIVQNLYENPIVICDVSCRNANVMFELGMRLAFDKPTIIIKDEVTPYSFDTSSIEHIAYPRDLRFGKIVDFKAKLAAKVASTMQKSEADPAFSPFLKQFGDFQAVKIDTKEVSGQEYIIDEIRNLRRSIDRLEAQKSASAPLPKNLLKNFKPTLRLGIPENGDVDEILRELKAIAPNATIHSINIDGNNLIILFDPNKVSQATFYAMQEYFNDKYPVEGGVFS